jgi:acetyltransferase-like isoleucine patch superfamily enzyme
MWRDPVEPDEFQRLLHDVHLARQEELQEWDRSLPFADAIFDRWDRARRLGFGEGASIYESASVFGAVQVGDNTWIGPNVLLDGSGGGLTIGRFCSVSAGVQVYTHDTVRWALSGGVAPRSTGAVSIGDCTYLGSQSIIVLGVEVGSHCVVGANSFVNHPVPDRTIVAGSPARPIGRVDGDGDDVRLSFNDS